MIYITFFIVILIDKRGVREALRERQRKRYDTTAHHRAPPAEKRYDPAPPHQRHTTHHAYTAATRLHTAYTRL